MWRVVDGLWRVLFAGIFGFCLILRVPEGFVFASSFRVIVDCRVPDSTSCIEKSSIVVHRKEIKIWVRIVEVSKFQSGGSTIASSQHC